MPKPITETSTFADLEVVLHSFGLTLFAHPDGARTLASVTGKLMDGTTRTCSQYGSTLAEAVQNSIAAWCVLAGDALLPKLATPVLP